MKFQSRSWLDRLSVFVEWEDCISMDATERLCIVTSKNNEQYKIIKHGEQRWYRTSSSSLAVGREWFTIEGSDQEFETFDDAVNTAIKTNLKQKVREILNHQNDPESAIETVIVSLDCTRDEAVDFVEAQEHA